MKILIQGAGPAGCAAAAMLSALGHEVEVVERRENLFTDGAGILLYSNALMCLERIGVLQEVLDSGCSMPGLTEFIDKDSNPIGKVTYPTLREHLPAYVGILRKRFLRILYDAALRNGAKFRFASGVDEVHEHERSVEVTIHGQQTSYDLLVAADGANSSLRTKLGGPESVFSGFGLWHSLHKRIPEVNEKITGVANGVLIGVIPISSDDMYLWASRQEPDNPWIEKSDWPSAMKSRFSQFSGWMGEVVRSVDHETYIHYTAVNETFMEPPWNIGRVVFVGDAAHATTPFMAQGGAQALQDIVELSFQLGCLSNRDLTLEEKLLRYATNRFTVANFVQTKSRAVGKRDRPPSVDLQRTQSEIDSFFSLLSQTAK